MKKFSEFCSDKEDVVGRWESTGLLRLIDEDKKQDLANCLEGQRIYNEVSTSSNCIAAFKRISIPLVRRIYPSEVIMGSVKPCKNWYKFESIHLPPSNYYEFETDVLPVPNWQQRQYLHNLDKANDLVGNIVKEIRDVFGKVKLHCFRYNEDDGTLEMNYDII